MSTPVRHDDGATKMKLYHLVIYIGVGAAGLWTGYHVGIGLPPSWRLFGKAGGAIATSNVAKTGSKVVSGQEDWTVGKTPADSKILLGVIRALSSDKRNGHEIYELFAILGSIDHASALAAAAELAGDGYPRCALFAVMGWAETDPKGACQWANSQRANAEYLNYALDGMMKEGNYATAAECAMGLTDGFGKMVFTTRLAEKWASVSEEDVLQWLGAFPVQEAELRDQAMGALLGTMATSEPKSIAALTWNTMPPGPSRAAALGSVVKNWLEHGGSADDISQWLASLPPSGDQSPALTQLAMQYAASNPRKAVDVVSSIPSGSDQNQAILFVGAKISSDSPDLQFSLMEKVTGPQRIPALITSITNWAQADPGAANDYVQNDPGLSAPEKQALQEAIAKVRR